VAKTPTAGFQLRQRAFCEALGKVAKVNTNTADSESSSPNWPELVARIGAGDPDAVKELYARISSLRGLFCRSLGLDHMDDMYHQLIVQLVQDIRANRLRSPERLLGYARTIAIRSVHIQIKRRVFSRQCECSVEEQVNHPPASAPNPEAAAVRNEQIEIAERILHALPLRDREVLTRFYLQEQSVEEIVRDLGLSETQFRLIKSRAKIRFQALCTERVARKPMAAISSPEMASRIA
jgi:RNA polymerase sigma-70 factor, ECF subfamily